MKNKNKKREPLIVTDPDSLGREFYRVYKPDYWLYQVSLLKNCHDNYASVKDYLLNNIKDVDENDFKRNLRMELHFLYFKMIETLFGVIYAMATNSNRDIWLALSFPEDWPPKYDRFLIHKIIQKYSEGKKNDIDFGRKIPCEELGHEITLLRWIFYFVCNLDFTDEEWDKNLDKIKKVLRIFAKDFSDRAEYNAYKHSLRCYNSPFEVRVGPRGSKPTQVVCQSNDAITFLQKRSVIDEHGKMRLTRKVEKVTKGFDFERDYKCCIIIYNLLKNIIDIRKHAYIEEFIGKSFTIYDLLDVDLFELHPPSARMRWST